MPANPNSQPSDEGVPVRLKGRMLPLNVAQISTADVQVVTDDLVGQLQALPKMLSGMPLLIEPQVDGLDVAALISRLRESGVLPAGLLSPSESHREQAEACGLPSVQAGAGKTRITRDAAPEVQAEPQPESEQAPKTAPEQGQEAAPVSTQAAEEEGGNSVQGVADEVVATKVVAQPVRSGQQIYAKGCDLIVTASVSAGAEVIADGSIHVYGALRGRALAGVQGNAQARIFCTQLGAELVSIAGHYRVAEDLNPNHLGRAVQIRLEDEKLITERQAK